MLKISKVTSVKQVTGLRLEGTITGPWVEELRQTCEPLLRAKPTLALDLSEVSFADNHGVALLARLKLRGVKLLKLTPFVEEQLKTLPRERNLT